MGMRVQIVIIGITVTTVPEFFYNDHGDYSDSHGCFYARLSPIAEPSPVARRPIAEPSPVARSLSRRPSPVARRPIAEPDR
jgi:hypothetical protein